MRSTPGTLRTSLCVTAVLIGGLTGCGSSAPDTTNDAAKSSDSRDDNRSKVADPGSRKSDTPKADTYSGRAGKQSEKNADSDQPSSDSDTTAGQRSTGRSGSDSGSGSGSGSKNSGQNAGPVEIEAVAGEWKRVDPKSKDVWELAIDGDGSVLSTISDNEYDGTIASSGQRTFRITFEGGDEPLTFGAVLSADGKTLGIFTREYSVNYTRVA